MIYFVTEKFLKEKTNVTQNVDAKDLSPYVATSVKTYIQPILGYNFTNDLLDKYNAETLSNKEMELVEFVQYMTAFYSAFDALPFISFRFSNKGIQSQSGDYSASDGIGAVEYVRNNILKFAKIHEQNLRSFLELNRKEFPLYLSNENNQIERPDKGGTRTDITWL